MTRSYSAGDGRFSSHNGDDVIGSSRASSRSYLSDVRPENRYTTPQLNTGTITVPQQAKRKLEYVYYHIPLLLK